MKFIKTAVFLLLLISVNNLLAFTLIVKSEDKIKHLKIAEKITIDPIEVEVGSNEIQLENYPNAVYFMRHKSNSNFNIISMIWVQSETSNIEVTVDQDYDITFTNLSEHQIELNKIFESSNQWSLFPYEPRPDKTLEPILALEAKSIIQNLKVVTEISVLENLLEISQQRNINNWSTEILSSHLNDPANIYNDGNLIKIQALDSLKNQIKIAPNNKKYMLIAISGSWCGPCIKGIPDLRKTYDDVGDKILFVSLWNDPNLKTFRENHKDVKQLISWPSLWDQHGVMASALNTKAYPSYILFDPSGNEINRWEGKAPKNLESEITN
ncbi:MAG: TlpA disulfide reductase family protein [Fulvivirga sp.]|uniref:TlpA family protein disulfide reductase n=1 Tax=Fulvivirga sp. TaxID=1931237 RepID=UPI0032EB9D4B